MVVINILYIFESVFLLDSFYIFLLKVTFNCLSIAIIFLFDRQRQLNSKKDEEIKREDEDTGNSCCSTRSIAVLVNFNQIVYYQEKDSQNLNYLVDCEPVEL